MVSTAEVISQERIIGKIHSGKPGKTVIFIGAMHGNEPSGWQAINIFFNSIVHEIHEFSGELWGITGNLKALKAGKRFIDEDLNRIWTEERVRYLLNNGHTDTLTSEQQEQLELCNLFERIFAGKSPQDCFVLDLHTTSAKKGIFSIVNNNPLSQQYASRLSSPVIKGLDKSLRGTLLNYLNRQDIPGMGVETGQHHAPHAVSNAIGVILQILALTGNIHEKLSNNLITKWCDNYPPAMNLPSGVFEVVHHYVIKPGASFKLKECFENFHPVKKGELIAYANAKPIYAPVDGYLLMPLIQSQGDDGFFIIQPS